MMEKGKLYLSYSQDVPIAEVFIGTFAPGNRLITHMEGLVDSTADAFLGAGIIGHLRDGGKDVYLIGSQHDYEMGLYDWLDTEDLDEDDPNSGVRELR